MTADAIDGVLGGLRPYRWGWRDDALPGVQFLGRPVGLRVDTDPTPAGNPPPPPDATETALVRLVLAGLPDLLPLLEREYREYNADHPDVIERVHEPHIWLSRDFLEEIGPGFWTFGVGIADAPDWGIHLEFDGLQFRRIWSGD